MKVVFICGPYRGKTKEEIRENIKTATSYALEVWRLGAIALCPHTNSAEFGGLGIPEEVFLEGYLGIIKDKRCDALFLMPNWTRSSGSRKEVQEATNVNIPSFISLGVLEKWLKEQENESNSD